MSSLGLDTLVPLDSSKKRRSTADRYVNRVDRRVEKRVPPPLEYSIPSQSEREYAYGPLVAGSSISWGALWPNQPIPEFRRM